MPETTPTRTPTNKGIGIIDTSDKQKVVSVAEGRIPVTSAMIDEWCAAYDKGTLPDGYEVEGIASNDRPPLHGKE